LAAIHLWNIPSRVLEIDKQGMKRVRSLPFQLEIIYSWTFLHGSKNVLVVTDPEVTSIDSSRNSRNPPRREAGTLRLFLIPQGCFVQDTKVSRWDANVMAIVTKRKGTSELYCQAYPLDPQLAAKLTRAHFGERIRLTEEEERLIAETQTKARAN
jgi:hypothetical protein